MVEAIDPELETTADALRVVPRHAFVTERWRHLAYADRPLPIGGGATISAPGIVAEMCDHLALASGDRTLEVGTGCGYHAAVTAEIVGAENVYTVEIDAELADAARERLTELGYGAVSIRVGDGREGWPEHAPYDKAYLTCADRTFPDAVVEQVRTEGLLLAPIGLADQRLVLATKLQDGSLDRLDCGPVQFVTMQGPDV
ncbi:protein-L-isoaspartate O-methyltransferase [Halalkaliarchaeum sp. AArc-CO]